MDKNPVIVSNLINQKVKDNSRFAQNFCKQFITSNNQPKYLFGRNIYANKVMESVNISGFIDDFTKETEYLGKPIVKIEEIPNDSLVLILSAGSPISAGARVKTLGLTCLDYFSFLKHSDIPLESILFDGNFQQAFLKNQLKFEWASNLLNDEVSSEQFKKLINFRLSKNLNFMEGFKTKEDEQYFEGFLDLKTEGESFVDIGGYDGLTSQKFISLCPNYHSIHFFEPEKKNLDIAKRNLETFKKISFYPLGLSDTLGTVKFSPYGSGSNMNDQGEVSINTDLLDNILHEPVSFIKMDIEGAEELAIKGASQTIKQYHPKLAISVYHKPNDFWKIPEQILSIRNDYSLYFRHYTESIYESVMFFIPSA